MERIAYFFEKTGRAFLGFGVFMVKNLLISSAFVGLFLIAFPAQFNSGLEFIRPLKTEAFHQGTMKLLGINKIKKVQEKAAAGSDLAEIGFSANGQALEEGPPAPNQEIIEQNKMNLRRVASLEEEIAYLRGEIRQLKVKYQYGGVEPTTAQKPTLTLQTGVGATPAKDDARAAK